MSEKEKDFDITKFEKFDEILGDNGQIIKSEFNIEDLSTQDFYKPTNYREPLGGTMPKVYLRCDSELFKDLLDKLKCKNSSYITYFNDCIDSLDDTPFLDKISLLLKRSHNTIHWQLDELASRIANFFNVPTVYNKAVAIGENHYTLSVDFMKEGDEIIIFKDFINKLEIGNIVLDEVKFSTLDNKVKNYLKTLNISNKEIRDLRKKLAKIFLFRKYILLDMDLNIPNLAFIHNKISNKIDLAPCYDMEFAFCLPKCYIDNIDEEIVAINKMFPDIIEDVYNHCIALLNSPNLDDFINKYDWSMTAPNFTFVDILNNFAYAVQKNIMKSVSV